MKTNILIIMLLLSSCATQKRAKPCAQCPHYTKFSAIFLEKVKLNPYPSQIALQTKYDQQ
ncbi:hypothetical protein H8D85_00325 [bacterium]|nr:hypothetical protein [bacterium]